MKLVFYTFLLLGHLTCDAQKKNSHQKQQKSKLDVPIELDLIVDSTLYNSYKNDTTKSLVGYKIWDIVEYPIDPRLIITSFKKDQLIVVTTSDNFCYSWKIKFITDGKIDSSGALHINVVGYDYKGMHTAQEGEIIQFGFRTLTNSTVIKNINKTKLKKIVLCSFETSYQKTFLYQKN
jgi:hypothetical protein